MSTAISVDKMYAVSETIENGEVMVTGHPRIWVVDGHVLLWPPSGNIDRSVIITPGPNWTRHECRILKDKIGNTILETNSYYCPRIVC